MKYWIAYFLVFAVSVSAMPLLAQRSAAGQVEQTVTVSKNGEITEMTVDEYVISALITQAADIESIECVKALAVALRSVALSCSLYGCKHEDFALCDSGDCCIALGNAGDTDESRMALLKTACEETKGELMTYRAMPAMALFTRCASKGTNESAEFPYLVSVGESDVCEIHITEREIAIDGEVAELLGNIEADPPYFVYGENDKCVLAIINGKTADVREIQKLFSLPSNEFVCEISESTLFVKCRGYGHGCGLNLCGAEKMAENGLDYRKILEIYYPELKMNKIHGC